MQRPKPCNQVARSKHSLLFKKYILNAVNFLNCSNLLIASVLGLGCVLFEQIAVGRKMGQTVNDSTIAVSRFH